MDSSTDLILVGDTSGDMSDTLDVSTNSHHPMGDNSFLFELADEGFNGADYNAIPPEIREKIARRAPNLGLADIKIRQIPGMVTFRITDSSQFEELYDQYMNDRSFQVSHIVLDTSAIDGEFPIEFVEFTSDFYRVTHANFKDMITPENTGVHDMLKYMRNIMYLSLSGVQGDMSFTTLDQLMCTPNWSVQRDPTLMNEIDTRSCALVSLDVSSTQVSDLTSLRGAQKLLHLNVSSCPNITSLAGPQTLTSLFANECVNLTSLETIESPIATLQVNMTPLQTFPHIPTLREVRVIGTAFNDPQSIQNVTIASNVDISFHDTVIDLRVLLSGNVTNLIADHCVFDDTFDGRVPSLEYASLNESNITTPSLLFFRNTQELSLRSCRQLRSVFTLGSYNTENGDIVPAGSVRRLDLYGCMNLTRLGELPLLEALNISSTNLGDNIVRELRNAQLLTLDDCPNITDLTPLDDYTHDSIPAQTKGISCNYSGVRNIGKMARLGQFLAAGCQLTKQALYNIRNARVISLKEVPFNTVEWLGQMRVSRTSRKIVQPSNVRSLDISYTRVSDLTPLRLTRNLAVLNVEGASVSDDEVQRLIRSNPAIQEVTLRNGRKWNRTGA